MLFGFGTSSAKFTHPLLDPLSSYAITKALSLSPQTTNFTRAPNTLIFSISFHSKAINDGKIILVYCPTSANVADIFTKVLAHSKVQKFVDMLRLC
jgi:hypothetical protein